MTTRSRLLIVFALAATMGLVLFLGLRTEEVRADSIPVILAILPEKALPGDAIHVWGYGFVIGTEAGSGIKGHVTFKDRLGGVTVIEKYLWWDDQFQIRLPDNLISGHFYEVVLEREGITSEPFEYITGGNPPGTDLEVELWTNTIDNMPYIYIEGLVSAWPFGLEVQYEGIRVFYTRTSNSTIPLEFANAFQGMIWDGNEFESIRWGQEYCFSFFLADDTCTYSDPLTTRCVTTPYRQVFLPLVANSY